MLAVLFLAFMNVCIVSGGGPHYCEHAHTNNCQNGATCNRLDNGYSYTCTCQPGFTGTNCQSVDCNSSVYCKNGGTCSLTNGGTGHTCNCAGGWIGPDCEQVDCSYPMHCLNGGTCTPINSGYYYSCSCTYGWTGSNCGDIDVCTPYTKADIVFVADVSESEGSETFVQQKQFIKNFVSKFPVGSLDCRYRFSLVTFSFEPVIHFYLDSHQDNNTLLDAIDAITVESGGPSFTGKALEKVNNEVFDTVNGTRDYVEHYVIVLTDGLSSDPVDTALQAANLKARMVKIYAIAVGNSINHAELLGMATYPKHAFPIHTPDSLQNLLKYTMFGCSDCTDEVTDVAVIMDISARIGAKNLNKQTEAVVHLIKHANVANNAVQFSFTTFAEQYEPQVDFNHFYDGPSLISWINSNIRMVKDSDSNISRALEYISSDGFTAVKGARTNSRKVVILFSSGEVDDLTLVKGQSKLLKDTGYLVVTVGIGLEANYT